MSWLGLSVGNICLKITSSSLTDLLTSLNVAGIVLNNIEPINELSTLITINKKDFVTLKRILSHREDQWIIQNKSGFYWTLVRLKERPIFISGLLVILMLIIFLPGRVLFVDIEGNQLIPEKKILDAAQQCGIVFGASRREIRSERIKNELLALLPELQWTGVNTYGCVAIITVREKSIKTEENNNTAVCSIIAAKDGIINNMTVLRGNPLCKVGEAVKEGQLLVSGYTDCGLTVRAEAADAEIFAQTKRSLECVSLAESDNRTTYTYKKEFYALKVGKKLINFFKYTGISDTTCVKMYEEKNLLLPGDFALPVTLVKITYYFYDTTNITTDNIDTYSWMRHQAEAYLQSQMLSGQILQRFETVKITKSVCSLSGHYACEELIGQIRTEEIWNYNGKSN